MTIKKQLARSHIAMVLIPVLAAGALLVLGLGLTLVLLDRALLARVTANLLDNSRKYGRAGERPRGYFRPGGGGAGGAGLHRQRPRGAAGAAAPAVRPVLPGRRRPPQAASDGVGCGLSPGPDGKIKQKTLTV